MEVLLGFFIALLIGLTGVGAGTLTAPLTILYLGLPPGVAVGTALLFGFLVKIPAGAIYAWRGHVDWEALRLLLLGGVPGVVLGSLLLTQLKGAANFVLMVVGATVVACALASLYRTFAPLKEAKPRKALLTPGAFGIGLEVGFSSAGAGALGLLLLLKAAHLAPHVAVGTDLLFGLLLSGVGGGLHLALGQAEGRTLFLLSLGGFLGAALGALLGNHLPRRPFRVALLLWLVYIGGRLILRGVGHG